MKLETLFHNGEDIDIIQPFYVSAVTTTTMIYTYTSIRKLFNTIILTVRKEKKSSTHTHTLTNTRKHARGHTHKHTA